MKTVRFDSELEVRELTDQTWRLMAPLIFYVDNDFHGVPTGFITDFASVPRIPIAYLMFGNSAHKSATCHDFLYSAKGGVSRAYADATLDGAMKAEGFSWFRRKAMYSAVRLFGAKFYKGSTS